VTVTPMTLGAKQRLFAGLVADLITKVYESGYEVTFGEAWRSPAEARRHGFENSNHCRRLAIDLNLFRNGQYLDKTEDWTTFGEWWEELHPLCRWGGRFQDGNHFSLEHDGVK
jgi:hypothetical protein